MVIGIIIGIVLFGAVVYMALDKKSDFKTRLVSIGALAVMILSLIICFAIVLTDNRVPVDPSNVIVGAPPEVKEDNHNMTALIFTILFFIVLFVVIVFLALKEHKKHAK